MKCRVTSVTSVVLAVAIWIAGPASAARAVEPVSFLIGYAAGKFLDPFVDPLLGRPDTVKLAREVDRLAKADQVHAALWAELKVRLGQCATKEEVRQAMREALAKIDRRLAEDAERIYQLENQQREIWKQMGFTQQQLNELQEESRRSFREVNRQIVQLGERMTDFERKFTRLSPEQQALAMCARGLDALRQSEYAEAVKWFQHARAVHDTDAGYCYYLAIAYRGLGKSERAEEMLAVGVARERQHGIPKWFTNNLDLLQGPSRAFVDNVRFDPTFGPQVPGARGVLVRTATSK